MKKSKKYFGNAESQTELEMQKLMERSSALSAELWQSYDPNHTGVAIPDNNDPRLIEIEQINEQLDSLRPKYQDRHGYVDRSGRIVIDLKFDYAGPFREGLAPVVYKRNPGYINHEGKMIIKFQDGIHPTPFSEGLAVVQFYDRERNGCGYIDRTGKIVIEPKFSLAEPFSNGLALVLIERDPEPDTIDILKSLEMKEISKMSKERIDELAEKLMPKSESVYINRQGEIIFKPIPERMAGGRNDEPNRLSEGLIRMQRNNKIGYVDLNGRFVIKPRFSDGSAFSEVKDASGNYKLAFIDHSGKIALATDFNTDGDLERNSTDFSEGWASLTEGLYPNVLKKEYQWVYIDKTGRIVLETDFYFAGRFHEGLAEVWDENSGKWGAIDKAGNLVVPLEYDSINEFSEGLAAVMISELVPRRRKKKEPQRVETQSENDDQQTVTVMMRSKESAPRKKR